MAEPDDRVLAALNGADWDDIAPKLLRFIIYYMREKSIDSLPDAMTPQELANDIVRRVFLGAQTGGKQGRSWDPAKHHSLLRHLKWIAMSDLSGKGLLGRNRDKDLLYMESEEELEALASDGSGAREDCDPDEAPFTVALKREIEGDTDLENAVAAIELGYSKSGDIAREAGIDPKVMYELRRKLRRKALRARERLRTSEVIQ